MRIVKFKSQLTIAFFAAVNHLNGPVRKPNFILKGLKGHGLWFVICDWWISIRFVCFCVSRFVVCDRYYDWRQRKTQLWRRLLNFRVRVFVKSAVRRKRYWCMWRMNFWEAEKEEENSYPCQKYKGQQTILIVSF